MQHHLAEDPRGCRVHGAVLGVEVVVHDGGHQVAEHDGHVVLQQPHHLLQGLQGVQVHLTVGLLQAVSDGVKHLRETGKRLTKKRGQGVVSPGKGIRVSE